MKTTNEPKTWIDNPKKLRVYQLKKKQYINGLMFDLATYQGMLRTGNRMHLGDNLSLKTILERETEIKAELLEIETNPNYRPWISSKDKQES